MTRSLWLILAALAPIAAIGFRFQPEKPTGATAATVRLPDVRVQHEYVKVAMPVTGSPSITGGRTRLANASAAQTPSVSQAVDRQVDAARPSTRYRPVARVSRDDSLFDKARRAFVGDGRHRPEPFPRPRGN